MDYVEPVGEVTDLGSPTLLKREESEDFPRNMNAFELLNFGSGIILNKLFESEPSNFVSHFITYENPKLVLQRIKQAMEKIDFIQKSEFLFAAVYEFKQAPLVSINVEILNLLPDVCIVTFSRLNGALKVYKRVVNSLMSSLEDLASE